MFTLGSLHGHRCTTQKLVGVVPVVDQLPTHGNSFEFGKVSTHHVPELVEESIGAKVSHGGTLPEDSVDLPTTRVAFCIVVW